MLLSREKLVCSGFFAPQVFELVKSCIKVLKYSSKLSCLIREILLYDSSVHNMLTRAFCIKSQTLEVSVSF